MRTISNFFIDLRSAYLNFFNLLSNEFLQRGVFITNPMGEKCMLGEDESKSMGFVAFKIVAKEYALTFSLFSKVKDGTIQNKVMVTCKEPDRYANSTDRFPVEFLENEQVLDHLATFLKGETKKPYGLVNYIDDLTRGLKTL